jgi:hypothetical protein
MPEGALKRGISRLFRVLAFAGPVLQLARQPYPDILLDLVNARADPGHSVLAKLAKGCPLVLEIWLTYAALPSGVPDYFKGVVRAIANRANTVYRNLVQARAGDTRAHLYNPVVNCVRLCTHRCR